jgi:hypothetical protein
MLRMRYVVSRKSMGQSADLVEWKTVHHCSVGAKCPTTIKYSDPDHSVSRERKSEHMDWKLSG